jgi:hypothetical protein
VRSRKLTTIGFVEKFVAEIKKETKLILVCSLIYEAFGIHAARCASFLLLVFGLGA